MNKLRNSRIIGTGMYVPPKVVTNFDLEKMMDTTDEWIRQRSGVVERRQVEPGQGPSDLAFEAAKLALDDAELSSEDLDLIIFSTLSPDYFFPGSGVFLQDMLGKKTVPAIDLRCQCSGFLFGLNVAQSMVATGQYNNILLVGAEVHSSAIEYATRGRDVSVLFGDGAGAVIIQGTDDSERKIIEVELHTQGEFRDQLKIEFPSMKQRPFITTKNVEDGTIYPRMDGRHVFKHAARRMPEVVGSVLDKAQVSPEDVDLYVFHQANLRINEMVMKRLGQPMEKSFNNIDRYGNCSAASIPMCLAEARAAGRINDGDLVCMASFGAGYTWAGALLRW